MLVVRFLAILLALALASACGGSDGGRAGTRSGSATAPDAGRAVIDRVVDGDTLDARIGRRTERVRLIGIDTPETNGRGGLRECFGAEATNHLTRLVPPGTEVRLVRDVDARDRFGRLLAYVYRLRDDLFVNAALARDGYADVATFPPNVAHSKEFVAAVREAREAGRGLWSACGSADKAIERSPP